MMLLRKEDLVLCCLGGEAVLRKADELWVEVWRGCEGGRRGRRAADGGFEVLMGRGSQSLGHWMGRLRRKGVRRMKLSRSCLTEVHLLIR